MAKETLLSISERTGHSVSTVSRVLSGQGRKYRISEKTIEVITAEARKCNYTPSLLAKSLRTNKTHTLGLVVPSIDNPFFANIANVIMLEAKHNGYTVVLVDSMENESNEKEGVRSLLSRNVDGIMVVPSGQDPAYLEHINDTLTPVVLIDRFFPETSLPYVTTDNYRGGVAATRYLIEQGHTDIACIQGITHSMPGRDRTKGYMDVMRENGLEENILIAGNSFSIQNGYIETKLLLNRPSPPTAIFSLSNMILLGAIRAISESNLKIPDDISIISFDDNIYLDYMNPAITRIAQPTDEIGSIATKILINSLGQKSPADTKIGLPARLIIRDSVAALRPGRPAATSLRGGRNADGVKAAK